MTRTMLVAVPAHRCNAHTSKRTGVMLEKKRGNQRKRKTVVMLTKCWQHQFKNQKEGKKKEQALAGAVTKKSRGSESCHKMTSRLHVI